MKTKVEFNAYLEDGESINKNHIYNWVLEAEQNNCEAVNIILGSGVSAKRFKIMLTDTKSEKP